MWLGLDIGICSVIKVYHLTDINGMARQYNRACSYGKRVLFRMRARAVPCHTFSSDYNIIDFSVQKIILTIFLHFRIQKIFKKKLIGTICTYNIIIDR